jgi:hypothetical protein
LLKVAKLVQVPYGATVVVVIAYVAISVAIVVATTAILQVSLCHP